jgi:hypothetical protein
VVSFPQVSPPKIHSVIKVIKSEEEKWRKNADPVEELKYEFTCLKTKHLQETRDIQLYGVIILRWILYVRRLYTKTSN